MIFLAKFGGFWQTFVTMFLNWTQNRWYGGCGGPSSFWCLYQSFWRSPLWLHKTFNETAFVQIISSFVGGRHFLSQGSVNLWFDWWVTYGIDPDEGVEVWGGGNQALNSGQHLEGLARFSYLFLYPKQSAGLTPVQSDFAQPRRGIS